MYFLFIIDKFSRLLELLPLQDKDPKLVANAAYSNWIKLYGVPRCIISDGGPECRSVGTILQLNFHITTANHPQSHGIVERAIGTVLMCLRKYLSSPQFFAVNTPEEVVLLLDLIQFACNTATNRITNITFCIVFGLNPITTVAAHLNQAEALLGLIPLDEIQEYLLC